MKKNRSETEAFPKLRAGTIEAVAREVDPAGYLPEPLDIYEGYNVVKYRGRIYAFPANVGRLDLSDPEQRQRPEVLVGRTRQEVESLVKENLGRVTIEYVGWLPMFAEFGNCGQHPQFEHLNHPPPGYRFNSSIRGKRFPSLDLFPRVALLIRSILKLGIASLRNGARLAEVYRFLLTRGFTSQLLIPKNVSLLFFPSVPFTYGQHPWVIEIEDTTSLFFPFLHNGRTDMLEPSEFPYLPVVKALIESGNCRGIITHVKSTADSLPVLFDNPKLREKITYSQLGIRSAPTERPTQKTDGEHLNLLFSNSWHQEPQSFYLRGGLDLLEAFAVLKKKYANIHLTLRTRLPESLEPRYLEIIRSCKIQIIDFFLPKKDWQRLFSESHIYVLPAARIHAVSVLEAMANGLVLIVSDGWGMEEYVRDGWNGIVVKGRYETCSWMDNKTGILRENYRPMFAIDSRMVEGLVKAISSLIDNPGLRSTLGERARRDVETRFTVENWNKGLQEALKKALQAGALE